MGGPYLLWGQAPFENLMETTHPSSHFHTPRVPQVEGILQSPLAHIWGAHRLSAILAALLTIPHPPHPLRGTSPPTRLHKPPVSPHWADLPPCPPDFLLSSDKDHRVGLALLLGAAAHPIRKGSPLGWSLRHPNLGRAPGRVPWELSSQ